MTKLFDKLWDIYFDIARLREDLEGLPAECGCDGGGSHAGGGCRCGHTRGTAPQCADYRPSLGRVHADVRAFKSDMRREDCQSLSGELGWDLVRAEATVGGVGRLAEEIGRDLEEYEKTCAAEALGRLRRRGEALDLRLRELGDALSDPASTTAKWLPLRLARGGGSGGTRPAPRAAGPAAEGPATPERLREIVGRHEVCYEVWPEWASLWGAKTQIGYRLELCGVNEHGDAEAEGHPTPGCPRCRRTYDDLRRIAEWAMPKEGERASRFEVEGFDRAWHVAPKQRRSRNEIVLAVKVLHRRGVNEPADECERACLAAMRARLAEIGVAEGAYRDVRPEAGAAR
jgi:hypothetical protein